MLSKAISRGKYLLAMLLGAGAMAAADALLFALCGVWLTARAALPSSPVWSMAVVVLAGAVIAATAALFFSTFLNRYLAAAVALLLFCAPAALHAQRHPWAVWWPGFAILVNVLRFQFHAGWKLDWVAVVIASFESGAFWAIAAAVFRPERCCSSGGIAAAARLGIRACCRGAGFFMRSRRVLHEPYQQSDF